MNAYIQRRFADSAITWKPFPHLVIENVLPEDMYAEMEAALPRRRYWAASKFMAREQPMFGTRPGNPSTPLLGKYAKTWQAKFGEYINRIDLLIVEKFAPVIEQYFARLESNGFLKERPRVSFGQSVFCRRSEEWNIQPHTHDITQLTQAMIYFPYEHSSEEQGTILYSAAMEVRRSDLFKTLVFPYAHIDGLRSIPFKPNTLVAFLNAPNAVHGTPSIDGPARRYVFTGMVMNREAFSDDLSGSVHTSAFTFQDPR